MKYGENINQVSVRKWNIHNVDYNSLKEAIKLNTKKDEAKSKAIVIPGQPDSSLHRFESELFEQMRLEHDRVTLFVSTKAQELLRRLQYLSDQIHRIILRCNQSSRTSSKRYTKLLRYEQELLQVGEDVNNLPRFVYAQAEAFRKLTKKYKKWTGSASLGECFKFEVLDNPKSFTHTDFSDLKSQYEYLLGDLRAITSQVSTAATPTPVDGYNPTISRRSSLVVNEGLGLAEQQDGSNTTQQNGYWNEYEHGSEVGDFNDDYVIWVSNGDDDSLIPEQLKAAVIKPFNAIKSLFSRRRAPDDEECVRSPLLRGYPSSLSYDTTLAVTPSQEPEEEDESTSEDEFPNGYETHFASLPSINEQKIERYRNDAQFRGTIGLFVISAIMLLVASILVSTGRHKMMAEVNAGVTIGVAAALACTFIGLAMFLLRTDKGSAIESFLVWAWFMLLCVGSGALLVQVVDGLS